MPKKVTTKSGRVEVPMDVRSEKDVGAFENLMHIGPLTIVLVYADWCGHCTTFKNNVWNQVHKIPNKTVNTASVHYDMLDKTSLANSKIEGYPSLLLIGTDKKPADFKDEMGKKTNAMPTPRTVNEMKRIVETPLPAPVKNANSVVKTILTNAKSTTATPAAAAVEPEMEELTVSEEVKNIGINNTGVKSTGMNNTGVMNTGMKNTTVKNTTVNNTGISNTDIINTNILNTNIKNTSIKNNTEVKNINSKNVVVPEETEENSETVDIMNTVLEKPSNTVSTSPTVSKNSYTPAPANTLLTPPDTLTDLVETQKIEPGQQLGGSRHRGGNLMATLLEITGEIAPAAALLTAASISASRVRSSHKKSSKKTRRVSRRKNNSTYRKRR